MSNDVSLVLSALATFIIGSGAAAILLPLLRRHQVLDVPNHRSSHSTPTVRGGGLAIVTALVGGLVTATVLVAPSAAPLPWILWFGSAVVAFSALGWAEDAWGLSIRARLAGQVLVAAAAGTAALVLSDLPTWLAAIAMLGGIFYVNTANFMDGVNGISGWNGTIVGSYFAIVGLVGDHASLTVSGAVAAAAFLSFLPWNSPRARMFMGDVGSYALGGGSWALAVAAVAAGVPILVAVAPLVVYSSDVVVTLLRRARRGDRLFDAHREHTYQRVHQITGSHQASMSHATVATLATSAIGLWTLSHPDVTWAALAGIATVCALYFLIPPVVAGLRESQGAEALAGKRASG